MTVLVQITAFYQHATTPEPATINHYDMARLCAQQSWRAQPLIRPVHLENISISLWLLLTWNPRLYVVNSHDTDLVFPVYSGFNARWI